MLNRLNDWCNKWRITVNQAKTKIIHFRSQKKARSDYDFRSGKYTIEYESSYKYLGVWINEYLDLFKSICEVTKSASRALGALYNKYLFAGGMSYGVYTKLVNSVVEPVRHLGNPVYKEIDVVLNKNDKQKSQPTLYTRRKKKVIQVNMCIANKQMQDKHKDQLPLPQAKRSKC